MFTLQDRDYLLEIKSTNPEIYDFISHLQKESAADTKTGCHDICNIISIIFGNFQLLELTNSSLKYCSRWNQMKEDISFLIHTMESISTYRYSKVITPISTDINSFMDTITNSIKSNTQYASLDVQFDNATPDIQILMDSRKILYIINSILHNLVENTTNAHVTISTECTETDFYIKISDDVTTIPDYILENLFQPFVTNKQQHVGLSLATSYQIMLAHNGSLSYSSNKETGLSFIMNFKR